MMSRARVRMFAQFAVAALLIQACTSPGSETSSTHQFSVLDNEGLRVALNEGGPKFPGHLRLQLDLSVGESEGPEEYIFYRPADLAVGPAGRMYLYDAGRHGILVYDANGKYLRTLGREGGGPGEFQGFGAVNLFPNPDGGLDAISDAGACWKRWDSSGALLFDHHAFNPSLARGIIRFPTADGETSFAYTNRAVVVDTMSHWRIHRLEADTKSLGVVAQYPRGRPAFAQKPGLWISLPFIQDLAVGRGLGGGFVLARGDSAVLDVYDASFNHILQIRWDQDPEPLTRQEFLDAYWEMPGNDREDPEDHQDPVWEFYQRVDPPPSKPVVAWLLVSHNDWSWVRLWGELGYSNTWSDERHREYVVFDERGEFMFHTELPFDPDAVTDRYLFDIFSDGEHSPEIRRYIWKRPEVGNPYWDIPY
jgi:hypothetical protein